jgi:hypothetical protein
MFKKLTPFPLQSFAHVGCPALASESDTHVLFWQTCIEMPTSKVNAV